MAGDGAAVQADLPAGAGWRFGAAAYGLELLTLPRPGAAARAPASRAGVDYHETCRLISCLGRGEWPPPVLEGFADDRYWFRWITGHQVSFVLWRLLAEALDGVPELPEPPRSLVETVCRYIHGYCAMLLYSGSCPQETYHRLIRPSLRRHHPSFSGGWAPDYGPVRHLFRGRLRVVARSSDVREAIRLHHLVHAEIAARLVPDGRSLLQRSTARHHDGRLLQQIYDNYFMTLRAPVTQHEIVAQLLRRLVGISQDLAANGLYPAADPARPSPVEPEVERYEQGLTGIIARVAARAASLPDESPSRPVPAHRSVS